MGVAAPRGGIDWAQRGAAYEAAAANPHHEGPHAALEDRPPAAVSGSIDKWARTWIVAGAAAVRGWDDLHLRRDEPLDRVLPVVDNQLRRHASQVRVGDVVGNETVDEARIEHVATVPSDQLDR